MEEDGTAKNMDRRPYLATECHNLKEAEKWRVQVSFFYQRIVYFYPHHKDQLGGLGCRTHTRYGRTEVIPYLN